MKTTRLIFLMALLAISTFTFGQPQNALHLDGNDDYINCGNDASLNITGPVTIEAWVYFDAVISQYVRIVEKDWATSYYLGSTYGYDGISFCMDANGDVNNVLESPTELIYQQIWTHVAGTWDGSTLRIYINGDEVASMPWANPSVTGSSNDVLIGKYYGNSTQNLTGYIDDVRIWNVARTASELRADMYKELDNPASEPNLVAYYSFNEGGGQTSADLSSNSNTAVLGGTLSIEPTDPSWITSNVPMPYHTVQNGIWHNVATWVDEQGWPFKAWAIVEIDHEVTAASDAVAGTLTINPTGALTVNSGSTLDISDSFTIKSGPAGTGSFIDNGTLNSPSPTVERYFAEDEWHLISSPVTNAQAGIFLGMYLQKYNETTGFWTDIINVTDPLNVMQGYALWIPTATTLTSEFSGTLNTGNLNFGFTANNPYGWNLLGNPYPSAIDWDLVVPVSNMNSAVYYLDAASGNYVSYVGGVGASRYIPPMQGFWISATSSGSLAFNNTMRTNTGKDIYYKSETDNLAVITASGFELTDKLYVRFDEEATPGFDGNFDAWKLISEFNQELPQVYSFAGDQKLSIDTRPATATIPAGFQAMTNGDFTLSLEDNTGFSMISVEDLFTGETTDLINGDYTFSYIVGDENARFVLHFEEITGTNIPWAGKISVWSFDHTVRINAEQTGSEVYIYNINGRLIENSPLNRGYNEIQIDGTGNYIVKVKSDSRVIAKKILIK